MAWGEEEEWLAALSLTSPVCFWTVCLYVWKARDIFSDCGSHRLSSSITDASSSCLCCVIFLSAKENFPNLLLHYPIILCIPEGASLNSLPRCTRDHWQIPQQGKVIILRSINSSQRRPTYSVFPAAFLSLMGSSRITLTNLFFKSVSSAYQRLRWWWILFSQL